MERIILTVLLLSAVTITTGQVCPENLYSCDGECRDLSEIKICDLVDDCVDGKDEADCSLRPPRIVTKFNDPHQYIEYFGSTAYKTPKEIQCRAVGSPPIDYKWKVNGREVQNVQGIMKYDRLTGVLTLINPNDLGREARGQYQCFASNGAGTAMSDIIFIEYAYLNRLPPGSNNQQSAEEYRYTKIVCQDKPDSNPAPEYSWHRKVPDAVDPDDTSSLTNVITSKRIAIDLQGDLHFTYAILDDASNPEHYLCSLYNEKSGLSTYGSDTNLVVSPATHEYSLPEIKFHQTVTAQLGMTAKIQCIFAGYPDVDVQWFDLSSQRIYEEPGKYEFDDFDRILKIFDVKEIDEGQYQCRGKNNVGETEKVAVVLNVVGPPIWVEQLEPQIVPAGQNVEFNCVARSLHGEPELDPPTWYRNGEKMSYNQFKFTPDRKKLTLTSVRKQYDVMCLQCKYENEVGVAFSDASLFIMNPIEILAATDPEITLQPDDVRTLYVDAEVDEPNILSYEWLFDNNTIVSEGPYTIGNDGRNLTIDTRSLNADEFDNLEGEYTVRVYHEYEEKIVTVKISTGPKEGPIVAAAGGDLWWIAIILAILAVFILILLIVCCLYRNRGGTWPVDRKERAAGHDPEKELADSGFVDLARADDDDDDYFKKPKMDEVSLPSDKPMASDDEDSMLEYGGEMDTSKFNEEGSFIGIYGEKKGKGGAPPPTQSTV